MTARTLKITTGALETTLKMGEKGAHWKRLILEANNIDELHSVFEEMFLEKIDKSHVNIFNVKFTKLSAQAKAEYLDILMDRYKKHGEYGFLTIAVQSLLRF